MFMFLRSHRSALWGSLVTVAVAAAGPSVVLASPDCSHAGPKLSAECVVKLDDCKKTSIVYVLAVLGRRSGMTEGDNLSNIAANSSKEVWYAKNSAFIKDTVHAIYTDEKTYRVLRAGIAPNMALELSKLIAGCAAPTPPSRSVRSNIGERFRRVPGRASSEDRNSNSFRRYPSRL